MPEARAVVPRFGNWDIDTDVPYTTVFERVRATKESNPSNFEGFDSNRQSYHSNHCEFNSPVSQSRAENGLPKAGHTRAEQHRRKRFIKEEHDTRSRATELHHRSNSSSSRRSSLEQIADHIFAESQYAAGNDSPVVSRQSVTSNTSWQTRHHLLNKDMNEPYTREGRHSHYVISGGPNAFRNPARVTAGNLGIASPRRERTISNELAGSQVVQSAGIRNQQKTVGFEVQNKALPKFGDWDTNNPNSSVEYTVIFNKIRDDKKATIQSSPLRAPRAASKVEEDLYKQNFTQKKSSGIWTILCCRKGLVL